MQADCVLIWTSSSLNRLNSGWDHQSALLWVPGEEIRAWKMQWNTKSAGVTWTDSLCNFTAFSSSRLRRVGDLDYTKCCATFQLWIKVCQAFQSSASPAVCSAELVDHSLGPGLFFWDSARITWNLYYSWNNDGGKLEKSRLWFLAPDKSNQMSSLLICFLTISSSRFTSQGLPHWVWGVLPQSPAPVVLSSAPWGTQSSINSPE